MGQFENDVITRWLTHSGDDHDMELTAGFAYVDSAGKRWEATTGTVVNGASIPRALWTVVGSPYTGDYRRASVLHDAYYLDHRGETRSAADRMFREAMVADGVGRFKAREMYAAVRIGGGAAWRTAAGLEVAAESAVPPEPQVDWDDFRRWYEEEGQSLGEAELDQALADRYGVSPSE